MIGHLTFAVLEAPCDLLKFVWCLLIETFSIETRDLLDHVWSLDGDSSSSILDKSSLVTMVNGYGILPILWRPDGGARICI